jgi:hypothetical protein
MLEQPDSQGEPWKACSGTSVGQNPWRSRDGSRQFWRVSHAKGVGRVAARAHARRSLVCEAGNSPTEYTWPVLRVAPTAPRHGPHRGVSPLPHVAGGVSDHAHEIIAESQPYRYLEHKLDPALHPLNVLDRLNIVDKHRHIAIRQANVVDTYLAGDDPLPRFEWHAETVSFDEHGAVVALVPSDPTVQVRGKTMLQVFLHEVPDGVHREVLLTLREAFSEVSRVFVQCSDECFGA